GLGRLKKDKLFVGFSLETQDLIKNSTKKLKQKNLDFIVATQFIKSRNVFGGNKLDVSIIDKTGKKIALKGKNKAFLAHVLLDKIEKLWYQIHR
ncbi:MAG: phosphopantothenoylcysteine decarboxylase, partial [Candidatus Omnitrophota bacterium]|nr:phosphopantothenoylcysteine decarboxylase [Candidatus Omnitrophota bacterium]